MNVKKIGMVFAVSILSIWLTSCSAGTGSTATQPVMAQTTYSYSTASLSGTYSMTWWNFYAAVSGPSYYTAVGTMKLDGSGNISGGTITEYAPGSPYPCTYNVTGTYTLQSTALGTGKVMLASTTTGCVASETWQIAIAAGNSGSQIQIARTDQEANGSAVKQ